MTGNIVKEDRAENVIEVALAKAKDYFVPRELLLLLMRLKDGLDPRDAVVAAYLLGRCNGNAEELERLT